MGHERCAEDGPDRVQLLLLLLLLPLLPLLLPLLPLLLPLLLCLVTAWHALAHKPILSLPDWNAAAGLPCVQWGRAQDMSFGERWIQAHAQVASELGIPLLVEKFGEQDTATPLVRWPQSS